MSQQAPAWLLSLLVTAALMVASLTLFMGKQPVRATHPNHVAAVLEGRADEGPPMTGVDEGHGGLMVPHAADAHTELQEARSQIEQQADELEVAALTEARLTAALREVERKFAALKQEKDVNPNDRRLPPPPPPPPPPALDKLQGTVAVGAGGGVGPAAGWFPKDAVFAPPSPKIRDDEDGWEFDERKVKVTYVRMRRKETPYTHGIETLRL